MRKHTTGRHAVVGIELRLGVRGIFLNAISLDRMSPLVDYDFSRDDPWGFIRFERRNLEVAWHDCSWTLMEGRGSSCLPHGATVGTDET